MLLTIKISVTTAPSHVSKPDWKLHSDPFLWNGKIYAKKKGSQKALTHVLDQPPDLLTNLKDVAHLPAQD